MSLCSRTLRALVALAFAAGADVNAANYTITASSPDSIDLSNVGLKPGDTIFLQAHTRKKLILRNLTAGTAQRPIRITNQGGQFIIDTTDTDKGLHFYNCRNFVLRGTPVGSAYGIKIARVSQPGAIALAFIQGSTDFEVCHLEIGNVGFAGLMAKSDELQRDAFTMRNVSIHDLYIHDTGGEGIYVGSSFYQDTAKNPHEIHGVSIHDNLIVNAGWDGIQLGCATQGASVRRNRILGYGLTDPSASDHSVQNEGIRINPGTTGRISENWIQGGNVGSGSGIFANPHGSSIYANNVIVAPGESGIVISSDAALKPGTTLALVNNTIVSPAQHGIEFWSLGSTGNIAANNLIAQPGGQFVFRKYASVQLAETTNFYPATEAAAGFRAAGDYRLGPGATNAIDKGSSMAAQGVTADLDGVTRPFGPATDIGAFEYYFSASGAPVIAAQPASQSVFTGADVTLKVIVAGNAPLTYAWTKNGDPVPDATGATLTLPAVALGAAGDYVVTITNALGTATSLPATLTVTPPPPDITTHPLSQTVTAGANVTFSVVAEGAGALTYQWKKNGDPLPGQTAATLALTSVAAGAAGNYTVTVTNSGGSTTSATAVLTVNAPPASPTTFAVDTLVSDATAATHLAASNTYTHAINFNASSTVTVNGVAFGTGTGNGGGAQAAKNYTFSAFSHTFTNFNSSATGGIHTLLATYGTNTSSASYALTLTGLTPGRRYTLALFTNSAHGPGKNWYRVSQSVDANTIDVDFSAAGTNSSRMLAIAYSATSSSVTFTFTRLDGVGTTGSSWVGFAGFANYEVSVPRQTAQRATVTGQFDFNYLLYLPQGYDPASTTKWPLLVFLHGMGERSNGETAPMDPVHLGKLRAVGPPLRIEQGAEFPFLVVSPQCAGSWWQGVELEAFIQDLVARYRIDRTRIYLTGMSMGAFGVYDLAQRQPSRYAAIAPVSAAPQVDAGNSAAAPRLRDLPIWAFHGASDPLYSVSSLQAYLDLVRGAGGNPTVTIYTSSPGNVHDSWVPAYADDALYAWLLTHSAQPATVVAPPQSATAPVGGNASFSVDVNGRWPWTFQWTKNGAPISGATGETFSLDDVKETDAGQYAVTVTNGVGSDTSTAAALTVPADAFRTWAQAAGLPMDRRGELDNPDGDDLANLAEFVLGSSPALPSTAPTTLGQVTIADKDYPTFGFNRRQALGDVAVAVVVTPDLDPAHDMGAVELSATPRGDGTDAVVVRSTQPLSAQPRQFFQVRATRP
jgi:predicted esterase